MNVKHSFALLAALTGAVAIPLTASSSEATAGTDATYEVTITNLTSKQIMSPVLLANHNELADVFEAGEPASGPLAILAEDGDPMPLANALGLNANVGSVHIGSGPIMPGQSETLSFDAFGRRVSLASMLITTNDAFAGMDSVLLPENDLVVRVPAYDAGSERNSELCEFIPGPPCGNGGVHDPAPAEGFVHVHPGFFGVGSLGASKYDWRNPVAKVEITRVR